MDRGGRVTLRERAKRARAIHEECVPAACGRQFDNVVKRGGAGLLVAVEGEMQPGLGAGRTAAFALAHLRGTR